MINVNDEFGSLTVLHRASGRGSMANSWWCRCVCGRTVKYSEAKLRSRSSCGCGKNSHGGFGTPEYSAWIEMRRRCHDNRRKDFKNYGGRGITVCSEWDNPKSGFVTFLACVGRKPSPAHTLGRIRNAGNYEPDNVSWQSVDEQNRNRRNSHVITFLKQTKTLKEWAADLNQPYGKLLQRLNRGWTIKETLMGKSKSSETTEMSGKKK